MPRFANLVKALTIGLLVVAMYVPAKPVLADPAPADVATRDGCSNYWMFNGVWRVRVTAVNPHLDPGTHQQIGWEITEQWRNGTTQTLSPADTFAWSQRLTLQNGQMVNAEDTTTGSLSQQTVDFHQFPPAAQFTQTQVFLVPNSDSSSKPEALIIAFNAAKLRQVAPNKPQFSVGTPNYRIKLDCNPSETAKAAAAQGGSVEVAAHEGCMNQYVSNGVWRVRISNLQPFLHDNAQVGWQLTEDWTNLTSRKLSPGTTSLQDQQLALKNDDTVSTSNSTGTALAYQKLTFNDFAPGGAFSQVQPFWPNAPFDATNAPVKLLIMFDAKAEARNTGLPQFGNGPANFRIDLTCSK